jgi:hypothetical protein
METFIQSFGEAAKTALGFSGNPAGPFYLAIL